MPSKSKAKVLNSKRVVCLLPQVEGFRYREVLFTSEGKLEHEIESESVQPLQLYSHLYWTVMVKRELSRKVKLSIYRSVYAPTLTILNSDLIIGMLHLKSRFVRPVNTF